MRILQINPVEVKSFVRHCENAIKDSILVGKGYDCIYIDAELTFLPFIIKSNESIVKAILKMHCKKIWGNHNQANICINNENVSAMVFEKGKYEWDVTNIIKSVRNNNPFHLHAFTKNQTDCCSIREFEPFSCDGKPMLEIFLDETPPIPEHRVINIIEECTARNFIQHCNWVDCSSLNQYAYFIQNLGDHDVEIKVQISPDKTMVCDDNGPLFIKPKEVIYQQPMRSARFLRLSYKTVSSSQPNPIKVWCQGKE